LECLFITKNIPNQIHDIDTYFCGHKALRKMPEGLVVVCHEQQVVCPVYFEI